MIWVGTTTPWLCEDFEEWLAFEALREKSIKENVNVTNMITGE